MKSPAITLLALMALTGCATSKVTPEQATPVPADRVYGFTQKTASDDARITVIRDRGLFGSACGFVIRIDGRRVAMLNTGEVVSFYVSPGEYTLSTGLSGQGLCGNLVDQSIQMVTKPNQNGAYRLSYDQSGLHIGPYLEEQYNRAYEFEEHSSARVNYDEVSSSSSSSSSAVSDGVYPQVSAHKWSEPVDAEKIFNEFLSKNLKRLDYESNSEYAARVGKLPNAVYTVKSGIFVNYDPETQEISVSPAAGHYHLNAFERNYREPDKVTRYYGVEGGGGFAKDVGSYIGSNAFGVSTVVNKTKEKEYYVIFGANKDILHMSALSLDGDCFATSSEMRKAQGRIIIEYMVKPVSPFTYTTRGLKSPTIDDPSHRDIDYNFIRADLLAARVKLAGGDKYLESCQVRFKESERY